MGVEKPPSLPPHCPRQVPAVGWLSSDPGAWCPVASVVGSLREHRSIGEKLAEAGAEKMSVVVL